MLFYFTDEETESRGGGVGDGEWRNFWKYQMVKQR